LTQNCSALLRSPHDIASPAPIDSRTRAQNFSELRIAETRSDSARTKIACPISRIIARENFLHRIALLARCGRLDSKALRYPRAARMSTSHKVQIVAIKLSEIAGYLAKLIPSARNSMPKEP
jgi:hypothetical protein